MTRDELNTLAGETEETLDAIAAEYESDEWDSSRLGKVKMGRPTLFDEPMRSVTFKESASTIKRIDERATSLRMTRSDYIRSLIDRDLASAS